MSILTKILRKPLLYYKLRKNSVYKQSYWSLFLNDLSRAVHWHRVQSRVKLHWRKGIIDYLSKYWNPTDAFKETEQAEKSAYKKVIWTCWFQGEENAPDLVKHCIDSIKKNAGNHPVIVLDEKSIANYVTLPKFILDKEKEGIITKTHLSDILRLALLNKYGGLWLDSTVFVSDVIPEDLFQHKFWSVKDELYHYGNFGSLYKWTAFCMASEPNDVLIRRSLQVLYDYWSHENAFVHYFIIDYVMSLVCMRDAEAKDEVDSVIPSNPHIHSLQLRGNEPYSKKVSDEIFFDTKFHKLSYKIDVSSSSDSLLNSVFRRSINDCNEKE